MALDRTDLAREDAKVGNLKLEASGTRDGPAMGPAAANLKRGQPGLMHVVSSGSRAKDRFDVKNRFANRLGSRLG